MITTVTKTCKSSDRQFAAIILLSVSPCAHAVHVVSMCVALCNIGEVIRLVVKRQYLA